MDGMQRFSSQVWNSSQNSSPLDAEASSDEVIASDAKPRPHVLFLIDHLMALGGGESNLLKVVELMPPELVRCSIATFRIKPEIQESIHVPVHIFPWKRVYHLGAWKAAFALRKLIRDEHVDIVQTYFETSNLWGGIVAKLSGALLLSSRRDMGILRKTKHALAYRVVNRLADRVLAVSEEVKKFCINADRIDPHKISVVYNGVDLKHIAAEDPAANPYATADWAAASHIITCVANVRRVKGIDVLVRTARTSLPRIAGRSLPGCRQPLRARILRGSAEDDLLHGPGKERQAPGLCRRSGAIAENEQCFLPAFPQ